MKKTLIGYTGFVGGNLNNQTKFDYLFNSSNINDIHNLKTDLLVIAAPSAVKWKANQEPEQDLQMIDDLISHLKKVKAKKVVQISTIDIYKNPINVDENTKIETESLHPYGKNRFYLEEFIRSQFKSHLIVRLPALFGAGLKKNFIFDLLNNNCLELTHKDSIFQFYNLDNLWNDINIALKNKISLLNISSEPVNAKQIAKEIFNIEFNNITEKTPANYDIKSIYFRFWNGENGYLYNKKQIFENLKEFVKNNED